MIQSWVRYGKAQFLQDRNPGVPGIVYKINPETEDLRRLEQARALWRKTAEVTGRPVREIYTGREIPPDSLSMDHFVPRSYISNDELWNLTPMSRALNSSKSNRLPSWDAFFNPFAESQFYLYDLIFGSAENRFPVLRACFEKCRRNNVNALWAAENLYVPGNTEAEFKEILSRNLKPVYDAARTQGYDVWRISQ